jgi:hypothetical protein
MNKLLMHCLQYLALNEKLFECLDTVNLLAWMRRMLNPLNRTWPDSSLILIQFLFVDPFVSRWAIGYVQDLKGSRYTG